MKLLKINSLKRGQSGDTIVEVLIAIAIVSAILVGAFLVSNHSTLAVRDSEEHAEAQQILQGQVEQLRAYIQANQPLPAGNAAFCFDSSGHQQPVQSDCLQQTYYTPWITPEAGNVYDCTITWPSVQGETAQEEFFYRVYAS